MYIFLFSTFIRSYLLFTFLCFTAVTAMPNNDNTLIYINHAQQTFFPIAAF